MEWPGECQASETRFSNSNEDGRVQLVYLGRSRGRPNLMLVHRLSLVAQTAADASLVVGCSRGGRGLNVGVTLEQDVLRPARRSGTIRSKEQWDTQRIALDDSAAAALHCRCRFSSPAQSRGRNDGAALRRTCWSAFSVEEHPSQVPGSWLANAAGGTFPLWLYRSCVCVCDTLTSHKGSAPRKMLHLRRAECATLAVLNSHPDGGNSVLSMASPSWKYMLHAGRRSTACL